MKQEVAHYCRQWSKIEKELHSLTLISMIKAKWNLKQFFLAKSSKKVIFITDIDGIYLEI